MTPDELAASSANESPARPRRCCGTMASCRRAEDLSRDDVGAQRRRVARATGRRVVSGASRFRNYPKLRDRLRETTKQVDRSQRRITRLEQRAADLRTANADNRRLYIELLKRALMHTLYRPLDIGARGERVQRELDEEQARAQGRDWPRFAQTMVGVQRLENVQHCVEAVLREDVPGDFIETGIWRGGTVIFMRGLLKAYGDPSDRLVFAADSFQGLPAADPEAYPADAPFVHNTNMEVAAPRPDALVPSMLAVPVDEVRRNFELYGLFDDRVRFLPGWFKDTLPTVRGPDVVRGPPRRRLLRVDDGRPRESVSEALRGRISHR